MINPNSIYRPNSPYTVSRPKYVVAEVVRIAQVVTSKSIANVIMYFFSFIFSFSVKNVPSTSGMKHIRFVANVDGSSAIDDILFTLLSICE